MIPPELLGAVLLAGVLWVLGWLWLWRSGEQAGEVMDMDLSGEDYEPAVLASYETRCPVCGEWIYEGEEIRPTDEGWAHADEVE